MSQGKIRNRGDKTGSIGSLLGVHKDIDATDYTLLAWEPPLPAAITNAPVFALRDHQPEPNAAQAQFLDISARRHTVATAVSAGAYVLSCAQGTYNLNGQAAVLRAASRFLAVQGSYSLNGQAATLQYGRKVTAAQGTYNLSGQAAPLAVARRLTAAQGQYNLNGQSATLIYSGAGSKTLTADQGNYSLNGQSVTFARGLKLTAVQGSYALSGQSVNLLHTYRLIAQQGSYALSGQDATLTYSGAGAAAAYDWIVRARRRGTRG